jgi:hypothetical protein
MSEVPGDVDPIISEHVIAIRNRFGLDGLRQAADLIAIELAIFESERVEDFDDADDGGGSGASGA